MTIERSQDWKLIQEIVCDDSVYPKVADDFYPNASEWEPIKSDQLWYIVARDGEHVLGLCALFPRNRICWDAHICILPRGYGKGLAQTLLTWIWTHTSCQRLMAEIPCSNSLALQFVKRAGFEEIGINRKSRMKNGKLEDQLLFGISKWES